MSSAGGARCVPSGRPPAPKTAAVPHATVRYVRPTQREKRERLYAYYAAKGILEQEREKEREKEKHKGSLSLSRGSCFTFCSTNEHSAIEFDRKRFSQGFTAGKDHTGLSPGVLNSRANSDFACRGSRSSKAVSDVSGSGERLLEHLRVLVNLYEVHDGRTSLGCVKRTFTVPELLPLTQTTDNEERRKTNTATTTTTTASITAAALENVQQGEKLSELGKNEKKGFSLEDTFNFTPKGAINTPQSYLRATRMSLPQVFVHECERHEEVPRELHLAEQERRTQSVRRHILEALKSFDTASRVANGASYDSGGNLRGRKESFQGYPFESMTGVCETLLDTPVDATPHSHMKRLLDCLANEPGVQKCAEAAARLATYVLMSSLPVELYEGDPEDYRFLRERARNARAGSVLPSKGPSVVGGESGLAPLSARGSRATSSAARPFDFKNASSAFNKTTSSWASESFKKDGYFLHQHSMALTQAVQSVALKKGIWLSSTMPMMHRPPLHACGLPLRAARDIARWQRPPSAYREAALFGSDERENTNTSAGFSSYAAAAAMGNFGSNEFLSKKTDSLRPKTLAPLLIIANGGYGVAPFSTDDDQTSFPQVVKRREDVFGAVDSESTLKENDAILYAMNNFMSPEPSLLPLHSVMQLICQSVCENRQVSMDEVDPDVSPVVFELLMDVVNSYESCFHSLLRMSFEPESSRSFFIHTYRETLLSWASIVICESAIGHAAERAGRGPANVFWTKGAIPATFTEEQLEEIALSGLVEKTFPSMTQWGYDEELFLRTVNTLRAVVFEAIARVKGELYFLVFGVDSRKNVLEKYSERLQHEQAMEAARREDAEEQLQAQLPGGGGGGAESSSASRVLSFLEGDKSLSTLQFLSRSTTPQSLPVGGRCHRQDLVQSLLSVTDGSLGSIMGRSGARSSSAKVSRQPGRSFHVAPSHMQNVSFSTTRNHPLRQMASGCSQDDDGGVLLESLRPASTTSPVTRVMREGEPCAPNLPNSSFTPLGDRLKLFRTREEKSKSVFCASATHSRPVSRQESHIFSRSRQCEIPGDLTVRSVRRDLVSLKFRGCRSPGSRPDAPAPPPAAPPTLLDTSTSSFSTTHLPAGTARTTRPATGEVTLASVVGSKQAAAVERMRKACENTMQFYMHFQNALSGKLKSDRYTKTDTQWYAAGSMGFFERRTVAAIRRSRQVAAFDLHYISPIMALGKCALWLPNGGVLDGADDEQQQGHPRHLLRPKELHLGETLVPWSL